MKQNGVIIASIPNIREYHIFLKILLAAAFKNSYKGILDRSQLRFFCKKNIISLLTSTMYTPVYVRSIFKLQKEFSKKKIIDALTFGLIRDFLTAQVVVAAKKG